MRQHTVELGNYFKVSIVRMDQEEKTFQLAILSGSKGLDIWDIDYYALEQLTGSPDVIEVHSEMSVYGAMNDIYSHLKENYPSLMKNIDGWY